MIDLFYSELEAHRDLIRPVRCFADIEKNQSYGVMSALLTGEEGEITLGKPEFLHILYRLGMQHDDTYLESGKFPWLSK